MGNGTVLPGPGQLVAVDHVCLPVASLEVQVECQAIEKKYFQIIFSEQKQGRGSEPMIFRMYGRGKVRTAIFLLLLLPSFKPRMSNN